jgi:hypothetical protein
MAVGTKEQSIIFLALVIIYLGIYTLRSADVPSGSSATALWAGFFSITLGVFALLTILFGPAQATIGSLVVAEKGYAGFFKLVAGVALLASAFFNFKLLRDGVQSDKMKWALYAQIGAHVLLVLAYFFDFNAARREIAGYRAMPVVTPGTAGFGTPGGMGLTSPRLPVRAR